MIGKIIFYDLTETEHEHLFIRSEAIRKDYSSLKELYLRCGHHMVEFHKFLRYITLSLHWKYNYSKVNK